MQTCQMCAARAVHQVLDLGPQPICNRFLTRADQPELRVALVLGVCEHCGLAQLTAGPSATELRPRYSWITYTEPEAHLPQLASSLAMLPDMSADAPIVGISLKDDSVLQHLRDRGFRSCRRLNECTDLDIQEPGAGVETVQDRLTVDRAAALVKRYGPAQLVVARHVLEHAHNPQAFLEALKRLLAPDGYLVLEVPDCQTAFELCDYTTIWEEHTLYFTAATFRAAFEQTGMSLAHFDLFPYPFESSLVGVGRSSRGGAALQIQAQTADAECGRLDRFGRDWPVRRESLQQLLSTFRDREGHVALLGAGHLGCAFLNFLGLERHVTFAVDDNPRKQGLFLPGSRLPIHGSSALDEHSVRMCLMAVGPDAETKIVERNRGFEARGGTLASIFPASRRALQLAQHG